ncbi:hypothetical protein PVAP13_1KG122500 [Panicum virgatum]|uniref:Uncharacterized protein n=1 Tax=Panicum virgatum TaxID=38727 RepID=A0A8T0XG81_PANVG|nr:hypothetical protein PVAP13_1KG122500 [Panicum virgatum]
MEAEQRPIFNTPSTSQINPIPHGDSSSMTSTLDPLTQSAESPAKEMSCHHAMVTQNNRSRPLRLFDEEHKVATAGACGHADKCHRRVLPRLRRASVTIYLCQVCHRVCLEFLNIVVCFLVACDPHSAGTSPF